MGHDAPPSLPPIQSIAEETHLPPPTNNTSSFQLPPLSFDTSGDTTPQATSSQPTPSSGMNTSPATSPPINEQARKSLTPITERSRETSTQGHQSPPSATATSRSGSIGGTATFLNTQTPIREESTSPGRIVESPNSFDAAQTSPPLMSPMSQDSHVPTLPSPISRGSVLASPTQGLRSPGLDSALGRVSSPSRGSTGEAANVRLPPSNAQTPAPTATESLTSSARFSPHPASPPPMSGIRLVGQPQHRQQQVQDEAILTQQEVQPSPPPTKRPTMLSPQASSSSSAWSQPSDPQPHQRSQQETPRAPSEYVFDEAGALYYMNQHKEQESTQTVTARPHDSDEDEEEDSDDQHSVLTNPMSMLTNPMSVSSHASPPRTQPFGVSHPQEELQRRQTPMAFDNNIRTGSPAGSATSGSGGGYLGARPMLARKPSGARAQPPAGRRHDPSVSSAVPLTNTSMDHNLTVDDDTVDALAALSFLEQQENGAPSSSSVAAAAAAQSPSQPQQAPPPPQILEPEERAASPQSISTQYKSSFAPSRQAAERKARSQAQQAAHDAVLHKPGRPNGKQRAKPKQREDGWESSEDEEEDDDDDEEEGDSDVEKGGPYAGSASRSSHGPQIAAPIGRNPVHQQQMRGLSPSASGADLREQMHQQQQGRQIRTLPQIPRGRSPAGM